MASPPTVHFKIPSLATPSIFTRFSLTSDSASSLHRLLNEKLDSLGRNNTSLCYVDADGDFCELRTAEDLETAIDHLHGSAVMLRTVEIVEEQGKKKTEGKHKRTRDSHRRRKSSSSSSCSLSAYDSGSDTLHIEPTNSKQRKDQKKSRKDMCLKKYKCCGKSSARANSTPTPQANPRGDYRMLYPNGANYPSTSSRTPYN